MCNDTRFNPHFIVDNQKNFITEVNSPSSILWRGRIDVLKSASGLEKTIISGALFSNDQQTIQAPVSDKNCTTDLSSRFVC